MTRISAYRVWPHDIPLLEPFGIAGGAQEVARNVFVELELSDGTRGFGEAAPFPAVNGETQEAVFGALEAVRELLVGQDVAQHRALAYRVAEALGATPSAKVAVESAVLDALCRHHRLPLLSFFGGAEQGLVTDITIPTGDVAHARASAARAWASGFTVLKVKLGRASLELDAQRLRAIHEVAPSAGLLLDANASLRAEDALELLRDLGAARERVVLFEQPTAAEDLEGLARVEREGRVRVAADESARSAADVARLVRLGSCNVINVKTAKLGVAEAVDVMATARTAGLGLMIGGMVESELSMTVSACLAAGFGGVEFVDLDTPLFMGPRPLLGGFRQEGPRLDLSGIEAGHGVSWLKPPGPC